MAARQIVTGTDFTLSLYPVSAVISFIAVVAAAPFFSKLIFMLDHDVWYDVCEHSFVGQPLNAFVNSVAASVSRRSDDYHVNILKDLQALTNGKKKT